MANRLVEKMNDLELCLEVVLRLSTIASHSPLNWKPLEIEAWFQRTTNRIWPMGNQMVI